ncbi:MAG: VanZ family protein [Acutalibacteraceae bacterium]
MLERDACLVTLMFFGLLVFSSVYYWLECCQKEKLSRIFGLMVFAFSCLFFVYLAVFRRSTHDVQAELTPFWSYRAVISGNYGIDVYAQIIENITIFVPIGFFFPFLLGEKRSSFLSVGAFGFLLSLFAELCQLIFSLGVCETDDLINNTVGTIVGFGIWYSMTARTAKKGRKLVLLTEKPERLVKGLIPLFAVYEILVIALALRKINI